MFEIGQKCKLCGMRRIEENGLTVFIVDIDEDVEDYYVVEEGRVNYHWVKWENLRNENNLS